MLKNGFVYCECGKKIMPIAPTDTVNCKAYCRYCKRYYQIVAANGKLYEYQKVSK